jgi:hypothetical protein
MGGIYLWPEEAKSIGCTALMSPVDGDQSSFSHCVCPSAFPFQLFSNILGSLLEAIKSKNTGSTPAQTSAAAGASTLVAAAGW